ncbi:NAD(P)/FAD-dependent oxidoreductase [Limibacter armeniacum]|uniref:NAD(P)/FAD-dependent oxidoreductase n=1 Tax=Limibacter armeniacum TaxID=466084 RepID=UPI002FE51463
MRLIIDTTELYKVKIYVIGGGAAGYFAAISAASTGNAQVTILEKSSNLLAKVKVSGGGRCNVTHSCFKPVDLSRRYPRGEKFLKKAFGKFMTTDTIQWFEDRGVTLKTEDDGRMFPVTDNSQTIIDCLQKEARNLGVTVKTRQEVQEILPSEEGGIWLSVKGGSERIFADKVIVTTGGSPKEAGLNWLKELGHAIEKPVPSLFTFNMPTEKVRELMGVAVPNAKVKVLGTKLESEGPLLITHWGMSGPAILRLSAWGARELADKQYQFKASINWLPEWKEEPFRAHLQKVRQEFGPRKVGNRNPFELPKRLWAYLIERMEISEEKRWADLSKKDWNKIVVTLLTDEYTVSGKTTFKEEFVTCGGVSLADIDVKTMESRVVKGLHFAGEVMDIDGITGGFNFQAAWTTGFVAGTSAAKDQAQ